MEKKIITTSDFVKGIRDMEAGVSYEIVSGETLAKRLHGWIRDNELDSYSRSIRKDKRIGITRDLSYNNTLDKCDNTQHIKMMWVDGYSEFMEFRHKDDINKSTEFKVKKMLNQGKVGYITDSSNGCYLACRPEDYKGLCSYFGSEYDKDDENKQYHYNSLFDDIRELFNDYREADTQCSNKKIYDVTRYVIVNIEKYRDILLNSKGIMKFEDNSEEFWVNKLWITACKDMGLKVKK